MAKTVTVLKRTSYGDQQVVFADVNITSYTTGGEPLTAADLGLPDVDYVDVGAPTTVGQVVGWRSSGSVLFAQRTGSALSGALIEAPAATPIGTVRVIAHGGGM